MDAKFKTVYMVSWIITILTAVASLGGLFINNLYRDTESFILAGWIANDWVDLLVAVPLMVICLVYTRRGSMRARLFLFGLLDFMLYNFAFYLFGAAINKFYLIYLALFTLSLAALIFGLIDLNINKISQAISVRLPRKLISGYMAIWALFLSVLWLSQIYNYILNNTIPMLNDSENAYRLVAALDLSLVVIPLIFGAFWLWKNNPWGYVLAAILNVKGIVYTIILAVGSTLSARSNITGAGTLLPLWIILCAASLISTVLLLESLQPVKP